MKLMRCFKIEEFILIVKDFLINKLKYNGNMTRRRRFNPRVLHIEEVDNIKYVCKGIPEIGMFYVFGILK